MATLAMTVGAITSTKTATNANANAIISGYIEARHGPVGGTPQEKLDWFINDLVGYVREQHALLKRQKAIDLAAVDAYVAAENWT